MFKEIVNIHEVYFMSIIQTVYPMNEAFYQITFYLKNVYFYLLFS